jgi:small subunit ribosomal protein S6
MSDVSELRSYEVTFIAEPNFDDERVNALVGTFTEFIDKQEGQVSKVDRMGKKRLAYTIEKRQYGYYLYAEVKMPGTGVGPLRRWFALSEDIFRHLVVKMSDRDVRLKALTNDRHRKEMDRRNAATRPERGPKKED